MGAGVGLIQRANNLVLSQVVSYLRNPNPRLTVGLLRRFGASVGAGTRIKRSIYLDNVYEDEQSTRDFSRLQFGKNVYIGDDVYFDLANEISIADDAVLSGRVSILTHADCNRSEYLSAVFPRVCEPVVIEEGAWIGFGATILAGVTIGQNAMVAANSLVRDDVPARTLVAGSPAKVVRELEPGERP